MPWFKVDDNLHTHPKARRAGLPAMGLWALAGSFAMSYKTNGFVPDWFVASWPNGKKLAASLVAAACWESATVDGETGWMFHDWADYQPSADEIEQEREQARERQRRRRANLREARAKA